MKLLVDSGATKANWALADKGEILKTTHTSGISPYFLDDEGIIALANQARLGLPTMIPKEVYFYSTGCNALEQRQRVEALFRKLFPEAALVQVNTDLLAAARASCQAQPGVVGILGTGSNACSYDGAQIVETAGGLGFILGDEGSGAALGKELISAFLNRELEPEIARELQEEFHLSRDNILQSVYQLPFPNRFLANFTPFVFQHRKTPTIQTILNGQFSLFFHRTVIPLYRKTPSPVNFVGSVAFYFQKEIETAAHVLGLPLGRFEQDPMPGLARYHK